MDTIFTPIDQMTWPRGQTFYYFTKIAPTGYTINVEVDVTIMRKALKEKGKKFFPAYLYLVTKVLNKMTEFRVAVKDEVVGYFDTLTPLYASFHEDDKTISFMWTEYNDDFSVFYRNYIEDNAQYGDVHGILAKPVMPPANSYTVSCVPWISFNSFSLHIYDNKEYFLPTVEAGKFYEKDGATIMPLSVTAHHATVDGYQINLFFEELKREMDNPENWLR